MLIKQNAVVMRKKCAAGFFFSISLPRPRHFSEASAGFQFRSKEGRREEEVGREFHLTLIFKTCRMNLTVML